VTGIALQVRLRIAAAGVITASDVITAWRTFRTPERKPSSGAAHQSPLPERP